MSRPPRIPVTGLTRPLNLASTTDAPRFRVDSVPFIDLFAIALFFAFLSGQFIFSPGIALDLPESTGPQIAGYRADAVLTVLDESFIVGGGIYPRERLREILEETYRDSNAGSDATLLVKVSRQANLQRLTAITETARAAGFRRVVLAVQEGS